MNTLSVHYNNSGNHGGFGEFLRIVQPAFVYSLNGNIEGDIQKYSPDTKWIYRRQSDGWQRLPEGFFNDDPAQSATKWLTEKPHGESTNLLDNWGMNQADYFDPLNEPAIDLPPNPSPEQIADMIHKAQYLNTWMMTALEIAYQHGLKLALFSFPFGSPSYDVWQYLLPSMRLGKQYGAILSLHAYTVSGPMIAYNPDGSLSDQTLNWTLRHRIIYSRHVPKDAQLPIVYTEASSGNGYAVQFSGQAWIDDMGAYAVEVSRDTVPGICAFQLGGDESNLTSVLLQYAQYIHDHPVIEQPPVDPPVGDKRLGDARVAYDRVFYRAKSDATREEWHTMCDLVYDHKATAGFSADDAGIGVGLKSKAVIEFGGEFQPDVIEAWYRTEYGVTSVEHRGFDALPDNTIRVPWLSQLGPNAAYAPGDCGTADVAMLANYYGRVCTVDEVSKATGNPAGFLLLGLSELVAVAAKFNVGLQAWYGASLNDLLMEVTLGKHPVIALLNYQSIPDTLRYDANYKSGHFVLVVGSDAEYVYYHDPYWPDARGAFRKMLRPIFDLAFSTVAPGNTTTRLALRVVPLTPPAPTPVDTYFGLGAGTQDEIPQSHADLYGRAFGADSHAAFKFLTLPDGGAMTRSITRIKAKNPGAFLMARMFFSVGNTPFSPQDFIDYSHNGTASAYANGIRDYEVGNEWNIEGAGINWSNGVEHGNWLKSVLSILKAHYPDAIFWMPALSPNPDAPAFFSQMISTGVGSLVHGYCYHDYFWTENGGQYNMVDETGGLQHLKLRRLLSATEQAKPTSITEFSCNTPAISPANKGAMYKRYREILKQNGTHSAFSFVLNWDDDQDINRENWANVNGGSTGIAEGYLAG